MSLQPPAENYHLIPFGKDEKIWSYLILIMILMMGIMTVGWVFIGDQNPPEEYYKYDDADDLFADFTTGNNYMSTGFLSDGVEPALINLAGGDIYLIGQQWDWLFYQDVNVLTALRAVQIKVDVNYKLHTGSIDVLHGFQLMGDDFILTLQTVPLYDYVLDFTPTTTGLYRIICNEFCGPSHHNMMALLEVVA